MLYFADEVSVASGAAGTTSGVAMARSPVVGDHVEAVATVRRPTNQLTQTQSWNYHVFGR